MKIHTCTICGATSDTSKFYAGVNQRCAECHKAKVRQNRANNPDHYRAYDAKRFKSNPKRREANKAYAATDAGKASIARSRAKWIFENREKALRAKQDWVERNPEKRAAHVLLGTAILCGRIKKPDTCSECGASGVIIHGHHDDYALPLDVRWVCPRCHAEIHKKERST